MGHELFGGSLFSMGDVVRRRAFEAGATTSAEIGKFAAALRADGGKGAIAEALIEQLRDPFVYTARPVHIDGVRSPAEVDTLRDYFGDDLAVCYVFASRPLRYGRLVGRDRDGEGEFTFEDFLDRESRERRWGLPLVGAAADIRIPNEGRRDVLRWRVHDGISRFIAARREA
jgi:dephospho-CoA kinase